MLKYYAAATALKLFSINQLTKNAYRAIGNNVGGKTRKKQLKPGYVERADKNLRHIEQAGAIADGNHVLELGTGWTHWEALFTRCFYDVKITLFDVWDNRQFEGFKAYAAQLSQELPEKTDRPPEKIRAAQHLLAKIAELPDFDAVYRHLNFEYLIEPSGSLEALDDGTIDLIISSDVLEHVHRDAMSGLAADMMRVLRPKGTASQQIVPGDHLAIYDKSVNPKNYIRFSDRQWKMMFENDVQYFNRLQHSDYVRIFTDAGFDILLEKITDSTDISGMNVHSRFENYDKRDLEGVVSTILIQKPA